MNNTMNNNDGGQQQLAVLGAFASGECFQMATQAAEMLASSTMVPQTYQGNPGSCFIALNTAMRLKMDPLMVMQNLYVVKGRPSWSGQFAIALVNTCSKFEATWFECRREGDFTSGTRMCARLADGGVVYGSWVTPEMVKAEGWQAKWKTMPEQMYKYRAAAFFARTECPEALMGLAVEGEAEDIASQARPEAKRPLFAASAVTAEKPAELPAAMPDQKVLPPQERLMAELHCDEGALNFAIMEASKGKVKQWSELTRAQLEKLAANADKLREFMSR